MNFKKTIDYRDAIFCIVMVLICFGILEVLLRHFVFDPTAAYIRTPGWSMHVRHNDLLPNVTEDHFYQVNRYGIRGVGPTLNADPKIAVIGGSTVEDWVLPDNMTWSQQLANALSDCAPNVWVANLGKGGVNARHHLIQLPETEKYMPRFDMLVVLLGLNDFLYDLHIHHPVVTPNNWWRRQALMYENYDEGWLATVAITKRLFKQFTNRKNLEQPVSDFGNYQKHLRDRYMAIKNDQWVDKLPDLTAHLENYRKTILALNFHAKSIGTRIIFISQPYLWSDDMSPQTKAQIFAGFIGDDIASPKTKWYTASALERGLASYNSVLLNTCRSENLTCVDAEKIIPKRPEFFYDDFHFSKLGASLLGQSVANTVRGRLGRC